MRFFFPFSVCGSCCAVAGGQASRRSRFDLCPSCNTAEGRCPAEGLVLAVFRFVSIVRGARRRNHDSHRLARVIRRGLSFHVAFRYPFLRACHDWAGPTSLSIRQRSWDFSPFAVFPACGSRRLFPPFIPTCRLPIVQHRCFLRLPAAVSELLPSESGVIRPTAERSTSASGSYCRRQAKPVASSDATDQSCPGFHCLLSGLQMCPGANWINQNAPKITFAPTTAGQRYSVALHCMHARACQANHKSPKSSKALKPRTISIRSWVS